ncbi:MAG: leucine-rich repeat protein [Butyrivibrio sp.]|nr:leucine-rich repeat protein [Butyrivibrio sp.]
MKNRKRLLVLLTTSTLLVSQSSVLLSYAAEPAAYVQSIENGANTYSSEEYENLLSSETSVSSDLEGESVVGDGESTETVSSEEVSDNSASASGEDVTTTDEEKEDDSVADASSEAGTNDSAEANNESADTASSQDEDTSEESDADNSASTASSEESDAASSASSTESSADAASSASSKETVEELELQANNIDSNITVSGWDFSGGKALAQFQIKCAYSSSLNTSDKWTSTYQKYQLLVQGQVGTLNTNIADIALTDTNIVSYTVAKDAEKSPKYYIYTVTVDVSEYISDKLDSGIETNLRYRVQTTTSNTYSDYSEYYSYTKPSTSLSAPATVEWYNKTTSYAGYVAWDSVENASGYIVRLYDDKTLINTVYTTNTKALLVENAQSLSSEDTIDYTFTVRAISSDITTAAFSEVTRSEALASRIGAPTNLSWNGMTATWQAPEDATNVSYYTVVLRKNGEAVSNYTVQLANNVFEYNFYDYLNPAIAADVKAGNENSYTFSVTANPITSPAFANSETITSDAYEYVDMISNIKWATDGDGTLSFNVNITAANYTLRIEYLGNLDSTASTISPKTLYNQKWGDFSGQLSDDGLFTLKADKYLTTVGIYKVTVTDATTKTSYYKRFTYDGASSGTLKAPTVTVETINKLKTGISWECKSDDNVSSYEIVLFNGNNSVSIIEEDYIEGEVIDLASYIVRTGYTKVKVRAISGDLSKYYSSSYSATKTLSASNLPLEESGSCGTNAEYALSGKRNNLTLKITGSGAITDYSDPTTGATQNIAPWYAYASQIKKVTIDDTITEFGTYSLYGLSAITTITLPGSLEVIDDYALYGCKALKGTLTVPASVTTIGKLAIASSSSISKIVFEGAAPTVTELITTKGSTNYGSFHKNATLYYSTRTTGWSDISDNKWNGYKIVKQTIAVEGMQINSITVAGTAVSTTDKLDISLDEYTTNKKNNRKVKDNYEIRLYASVLPEDASNQAYTVKSSSAAIASVSAENGYIVITPKKTGVTTITLTAKGNSKMKATCQVIVYSKTGWQASGKNYYYIGSDGNRLSGWNQVTIYKNTKDTNEYWQYFDPITGYRKTGWLKDDNDNLYYLNTKTGVLTTGLTKISGKYYDLATTNVSAYQSKEASPVYGLGIATVGWNSDYTSYFDAKGARVTGWKEIDAGTDNWYYFDKNGVKLTGWQKIGSTKYYLMQGSGNAQEDGIKQYGVITVDEAGNYVAAGASSSGLIYRLTEENSNKKAETANGKQVVGWYSVKETSVDSSKTVTNKYYYNKSTGALVTGWQRISNAWYYFEEDGKLTTNTTMSITVNGAVYAATLKNGKITKGWMSGSTYLSGLQEIDGDTYYFNAKGIALVGKRTIKKLTKVTTKNRTFYFDTATGKMFTGDFNAKAHYYTAEEVEALGGDKADVMVGELKK